MSILKFLASIWEAIKQHFSTLDDEVKIILQTVTALVENIKKAEDTGIPDLLLSLLPAGAPEQVNQVIKTWLPKVLLDLNLATNCLATDDPQKILQAALATLKLSSDEAKNIYYHGLASLILEKASDGKFTWSDAVAVEEYYFKNIYKAA